MKTLRRKAFRTALVLTTLALAALTARAADGDPLEPLKGAIAHQDDLAAKGQYEQLMTEADFAARRDATPQTLYLLGRALGNVALVKKQQKKDKEFQELIDRAHRAFDQSLESDTLLYPPALLGQARCERYLGNYDQAIQLLSRAIKLAPEFKAATVELAQVYAEKGRYPEAELTLRQQLERNPRDSDYRTLLGMVKLTRRRWEEAEKEFRVLLGNDPNNPAARKLLATALMLQERDDKLKEAAEHFEAYRRVVPGEDESYRSLFMIYSRLNERAKCMKALDDMARQFAGDERGVWAKRKTQELSSDAAWAPRPQDSRVVIEDNLKSKDPEVLRRTLADLRKLSTDRLPLGVYLLLAPQAAPSDVRKSAVSLIGTMHDPRTLKILEIVLFHPKERDPDLDVRREAAASIAGLPTPAITAILYKALDDGDEALRESAVRGLTTVTGKTFRADGAGKPDAAGWAFEREQWRTWWNGDGTLAKRDACEELKKLTEGMRQGRRRLAEYALLCMDDVNPRTWRAAYGLFRALSGQNFGGDGAGDLPPDQRANVNRSARDWFAREGQKEDG